MSPSIGREEALGGITERGGGRPHVERPSELQIKILKHMLSCTEPETVSHISKEIGALQPAVFRSVKFMLRDGVLAKLTLFAGRKEVTLTNRGMAIAILAGIKHNKLEEFLNKSEGFSKGVDKERHQLIQTIMLLGHRHWPTKQDYVLKTALEYMVITEWFENEKETITKEDRMRLFIFLIPDILTHVKNVKDIVELIDKFEIDKRRFGELLLDEINSAVEVINEYKKYTNISDSLLKGTKLKIFLKNVQEMVKPRLRLDSEYDLSERELQVNGIKLTERVREKQQSIKSPESMNKITDNLISDAKASQPMTTKESLPKKKKPSPS